MEDRQTVDERCHRSFRGHGKDQPVDNVPHPFTNDVLLDRIAFAIDEEIRLYGHVVENAETPRSYGMSLLFYSVSLELIHGSGLRPVARSCGAEASSALDAPYHAVVWCRRGLSRLHRLVDRQSHRAPSALQAQHLAYCDQRYDDVRAQRADLSCGTVNRIVEAGLEPVIEVCTTPHISVPQY